MVSSSEFKQYKEDLLQKKGSGSDKGTKQKKKGKRKGRECKRRKKENRKKERKRKKRKGCKKMEKEKAQEKREKKQRQTNRKRQKTDGDKQNADTDMKRPAAVDIDNAHANGSSDTDNGIKHLTTTEDIGNALVSGVLIPVSGPSFNRDVCFGCAGEKDNGSMYSVQMMKV